MGVFVKYGSTLKFVQVFSDKTVNGYAICKTAVSYTHLKKRGDDITFLRRIVRGGADDSFGIEVAKLAGVPEKVIRRAKQVLAELEAADPAASEYRASLHVLEEPVQLTMNSVDSEVLQKLRSVDVNTLTPIECMNVLFELRNMLK